MRRGLYAYLCALHLVFLAFTFALAHENLVLLLVLEALLVISLVGGILLVRRAREPLAYTRRLRELLQEQNYAVRLQSADTPELDQLVAEFNSLLAALHQERLKIGEQQGFLDHLLEATPSGVIVFDFDGRISLLNASARQLLGLVQPIGRRLGDWAADQASLEPGTDRHASLALLAQLDTLPAGEGRLLTSSGGRRFRAQRGGFYDRGFTRHFLMIDELTAELESSERAAYEKLIRVLAHEVNNTVGATGSVLQSLLVYGAQLRESDRGDFGTAIEAVRQRNTSLGQFIDRFAQVVKMPAPQLAAHDLAGLADDILALFREHARQRGVDIGWRRRDQAHLLQMDRGLMEQALINVVKNAIEAAEAGPAPRSVLLDLAANGKEVSLTVADSGGQLKAVPAEQLFTPFFSTKKGGQGLGLLFVREVLMRHGLAFQLSQAEAETRFVMTWA